MRKIHKIDHLVASSPTLEVSTCVDSFRSRGLEEVIGQKDP
jgi:hypothetical protein